VLKPGGHFCISDAVLGGHLPEGLKEAAEMYAGCVSGALRKEEYLDIIRSQGFTRISVLKEKEIRIPSPVLLKYISLDELRAFRREKTGIFSITVKAFK